MSVIITEAEAIVELANAIQYIGFLFTLIVIGKSFLYFTSPKTGYVVFNSKQLKELIEAIKKR